MRSNKKGGPPLLLLLLLLRCIPGLTGGSQLRMTDEDDESQSLLLDALAVSGVVKSGGTSRIRGFLRWWCLSMVSWKSAWIGVEEGRLVEYATTPSVRLMQLWCGNSCCCAMADKFRSKHERQEAASDVAERAGFFEWCW